MEEVAMEEVAFEEENEPKNGEECSVCIVDNMNFTSIDEAPHRAFTDWWPTAARLVIMGAYDDIEKRRVAVQALLPIVDDFPSVQPTTVRMATPEMVVLHNLYSSRLMFEEQHIRQVKERWSTAIDTAIERMSRLLKDHDTTLDGLKTRAKTFADDFSEPESRQIIVSELETYAARLRRELNLEMRLTRAEAITMEPTKRPETKQLDMRIETTMHELKDKDTVRRIKQVYDLHVRNVEHDMATELMKQCKSRWLRALR